MVPLYKQMILVDTLPETNIAPKNEWLEDEFPFWDRLFSGDHYVSFREGRYFNPNTNPLLAM